MLNKKNKKINKKCRQRDTGSCVFQELFFSMPACGKYFTVLFKLASSGLNVMKYFSVKHSMHKNISLLLFKCFNVMKHFSVQQMKAQKKKQLLDLPHAGIEKTAIGNYMIQSPFVCTFYPANCVHCMILLSLSYSLLMSEDQQILMKQICRIK